MKDGAMPVCLFYFFVVTHLILHHATLHSCAFCWLPWCCLSCHSRDSLCFAINLCTAQNSPVDSQHSNTAPPLLMLLLLAETGLDVRISVVVHRASMASNRCGKENLKPSLFCMSLRLLLQQSLVPPPGLFLACSVSYFYQN